MKKISISDEWLFKGPADKDYKTLDLPHDYAITLPRTADAQGGPSTGFFQGGTGEYIKYLDMSDSTHYILDVDGAYMCTAVLLNGRQLTMHPHGYAPMLVDLTRRKRSDIVNKLVIRTNALQTSTRWYSGAGIYRYVYMWTGGDADTGARIEPWDVFVKTPEIGTAVCEYAVSCDEDTAAVLIAEITDALGSKLAKDETNVCLTAGQKTGVSLTLTVDGAKAWGIDEPNLYTLSTTLMRDGKILDTDTRKFGFRTVSVNVNDGLLLNGKSVKLRGGCIHHDNGALGAAESYASCRRKLTLLKNAGFNALRIAHNPPSTTLMELCDEMGIIVMDEAFDCWNLSKGGEANYHLFFNDWWERDLTAMVLRDRSHPCVIAYSLGNEIPESDGLSDGGEWTGRMSKVVRNFDDTRIVTSAVCKLMVNADPHDPAEYTEDLLARFGEADSKWEERTESYFAPLDMSGYNYMYTDYEHHHELFPERVIWGSETQVLNFWYSWHEVLKHPYVVGDFTWTAYDNLGEAGTGMAKWARDGIIPGYVVADYPWRSCYQGDFDLCGYMRPQGYFRHAVWLGGWEPKIFTTHPEHYGEQYTGTGWHWWDVHDSWTFADKYLGKPVKCETYTDADKVEWFINGRSLGITEVDKAVASIDIPYERGTVTAVAIKDGKEVSGSELHTVGKADKLTAVPENEFYGDGHDLCFIDIAVTDENGDRIPDDKRKISVFVDGGELLAVFSGDPANEDNYGTPVCHLFEGRALAVIRAAHSGDVTLFVTADGVKQAKTVITAK